ncbi:MAG TPA: DUF4395 domain-containing protein [Nocardioides sp.]|nr:DUF4395 domain-containing protein [Nocardioides sp.]
MTTTNPHPAASGTRTPGGIDPRGPQLTAAITAVVLVVILLLPTPWAAVLTGVQAVLFAIGAVRGVQHTPHAWLFRTVVRPRLSPPDELEDPAPPRFAQGVGLAFTLVALVGFTTGVTLLGQVAIGFALVAALLNAVFRFCLGCELYLLIKRSTTAH